MRMSPRTSASTRCSPHSIIRSINRAAGSTPAASAPWAPPPAALGVKLALPEETVVCVTGDGSIQMNIQELSTALQYNLPVVVVNLNNRYLGMVKQWQDMIYSGRHSQSYMDSLPDFVKLAEAYGHVGIAIRTPDELESKLAQALAEKERLVFVDVTVDETEHVYPMQIRRKHGRNVA
ncbi:thiamine pyrophosphate-dependent enzyme [Serratia ureilytica]